MRVGYIGLGSLGGPIADCIARGAFAITVFDIAPEAMVRFADRGITLAASPQQVAEASDLLCVCVQTDEDTIALTKDGSLFAAMAAGGVFIIHSTIAPELAQALAEQAHAHGVAVLDCGVSRGGGAAEVNGDQ